MKRTEKATDTILVKAYTNSEWDKWILPLSIVEKCGRSSYGKEWKRYRSLRRTVNCVQSATMVHPWIFSQAEDEDILKLLEKEDWTFVEMDEDEERTLASPENRLETYRLSIFPKGGFMYSAFGKHTGEEFWTEELTFTDIANR